MLFRFLILCALALSACDSPIHNRVREVSSQSQSQMRELDLGTQHLKVSVIWLQGPHGDIHKTSELMVFVRNQQGELTDVSKDLDLHFYATMPSMGHPMDHAGHFIRLEKGIYLNSTIRFNMPGDWRMELWWMDANLNIQEELTWDEFL